MKHFAQALLALDPGALFILAIAATVLFWSWRAGRLAISNAREKRETARRRVGWRHKVKVVHPPVLRPHKPGDHTDTIPPAAEERNGRIKCVALVALFLLAAAPARAERWAVKTLTDDQKATVNLTPVVPTTIRALCATKPTTGIYGPKGKHHRDAPVETTVWRVTARLVYVHREGDGDLHLILAEPDDPAVTMIAEVPLPTENPAYAATWEAIRRDLGARHLTGECNVLVTVEGVGFFDFPHHQRGVAKGNAIELHPVMKLTVLP